MLQPSRSRYVSITHVIQYSATNRSYYQMLEEGMGIFKMNNKNADLERYFFWRSSPWLMHEAWKFLFRSVFCFWYIQKNVCTHKNFLTLIPMSSVSSLTTVVSLKYIFHWIISKVWFKQTVLKCSADMRKENFDSSIFIHKWALKSNFH